jgi:transcriptional regulator with XRE-family HTH domain
MSAESERFGGRLRELREGAGLTQKQLAEAACLTTDGLVKLEAGRRGPTWETVLALAAALGVTCEAFTRPPADAAPRGPGRPPKDADRTPAPRRPRGRPRKSAGG